METKKLKVLGVCHKYPNLKRYILWALYLLEDMPQLFGAIEFSTTAVPGFDVYIVDDISNPIPKALVIHMKSKFRI
jgi:hypothetical protein